MEDSENFNRRKKHERKYQCSKPMQPDHRSTIYRCRIRARCIWKANINYIDLSSYYDSNDFVYQQFFLYVLIKSALQLILINNGFRKSEFVRITFLSDHIFIN